MKSKLTLSLLLCGLAAALLPFLGGGCATAARDHAWFNTQTNYVPVVHVFTNTVVVTNTVEVVRQVERVAAVANPASGAIALVTDTVNTTDVEQPVAWQTNVVTTTNQVAHDVVVTPKPGASAAVSGVAGALAGPWGTFAGVAVTGLLGIWARQRQRAINRQIGADLAESGTVNEVLAQSIEVGRELLKSTPQGQQAEAAYLQWLQRHQRARGVINAVGELVNRTVDRDAARDVVKIIAPQVPPAK